jgi:hypothetical protein
MLLLFESDRACVVLMLFVAECNRNTVTTYQAIPVPGSN